MHISNVYTLCIYMYIWICTYNMIALCFGQVCIATTVRDGVAIANKGQAGSPHCQRTQSTTQCIIDISILHINRYLGQLSALQRPLNITHCRSPPCILLCSLPLICLGGMMHQMSHLWFLATTGAPHCNFVWFSLRPVPASYLSLRISTIVSIQLGSLNTIQYHMLQCSNI